MVLLSQIIPKRILEISQKINQSSRKFMNAQVENHHNVNIKKKNEIYLV